jgi:hypothetical protein
MDLSSCCKDYYVNQVRTGAGSFPVYTPRRGDGFFGDLFKSAVPFLKNTVAPKLIKGAASVATDVIKGKSLGASLINRAKEGIFGGPNTTSSTETVRPKRKKRIFNKRKVKRSRDAF